jgi:hypothetical protein
MYHLSDNRIHANANKVCTKLELFHYDETTNIFTSYAKRHAVVSKKGGGTLKQAWLVLEAESDLY